MKNYLEKLNKAQYEAATTIDGALLIIAGAGSGKTHTLISRIVYMLKNGIQPENILLLTFTNKAAKEMKDRIELTIGSAANRVTACTFHSFCAMFLRKYARYIGIDNSFGVIDSTDASDAMDIVRQVFLEEEAKKGIEHNLKDFPSTKVLCYIYEQSVNAVMSIDDCIVENGQVGYRDAITDIIKMYVQYKRDRNLLDYDDLLFYTKAVLSNNEDIRSEWDSKYSRIMVDEYQDTNKIQDSILDLLTRDYKHIAVVGDGQQSIYKFRFADVNNIFTFANRYEGCKTIALTENYRSSQEILDFSNAMMGYVKEGVYKNLHGQFNGKKPILKIVSDGREESDYIINEVLRRNREGVPLKDIAVIIRSSRQSSMLEVELGRAGIPFEKFGGKKFLEKPAVKDVLSYLRIAVNERDELALFRLLQLYPGIGKCYAKNIANEIQKDGFVGLEEKFAKKKYAKYLSEITELINEFKTMSLTEQLECLLGNYYYDTKLRLIRESKINEVKKAEKENELDVQSKEIKALLDLAANYKTTEQFLNDVVLDATAEKQKADDYLNVTTIHSAKGLEYDTVFIMDAIQGVFPKTREGDEEDAEEMRCMYVASTRPKNELHIVYPEFNVMVGAGSLSHYIDKPDVLNTLDVKGSLRKKSYWF